MATLTNGLVISDSLLRLIRDRRYESKCLLLLWRAIQRINGMANSRFGIVKSRETRILAKRLPGNYFTFREEEGLISYMPKGKKQAMNDDETWKRDGRQSMKPGRWMRSMLNPRLARRIPDDHYAIVAEIVRHEELKHRLTFKEVSPKEGYDQGKFNNLIKSCMWSLDVAPFYDAFKAKVLVAFNGVDSKWKGRAIIWRNVKWRGNPILKTWHGPITLLDRIYSDTAETAMAMKEYAASQGWWSKKTQGRDVQVFTTPCGDDSRPILRVETEADLRKIRFYPYLDTLPNGGMNFIGNVAPEGGHRFIYTGTSGGRAGDERLPDRVLLWNGNYGDIEDTVLIGMTRLYKDDPRIVKCHYSGNFILRDNAYWMAPPTGDGFYVSRSFVTTAQRAGNRR